MANEILIRDVAGCSLDQICFAADELTLSPADSGTDFRIGSPTYVDLTLSQLGEGQVRQSDKADLGAVRARRYSVLAAIDCTGEGPSANRRVEFYWAPSTSATAGNGNVMAISGVDSDCPDAGAVGSPTDEEIMRMSQYIGSLSSSNDATEQCGFVGIFEPATRYGQLLVHNRTNDAFETGDTEMYVVFNPLVDEIQ